MVFDDKNLELLSVSIPVTDWYDARDEIDSLRESVDRLQKVVEALAELYRTERVKTWEMVLTKMLEREDKKIREGRARK